MSVARWLLVTSVHPFSCFTHDRYVIYLLIISGEISTPNVRGTVGFFFSTNIGLGILFTSLLGLGLDWRWISGVCALTPFVLFAMLYFVPESPYFLVKQSQSMIAFACQIFTESKQAFLSYKIFLAQ